MTARPDLTSRSWLALLLVAALALRGLIPEGFMAVAGAGGVSLELCPGAGELPPGLLAHDHAGHTGHGQAGDHGPGGSVPGHHASCLFSTGAHTAFAAVLAAPTLVAASLAACTERPRTRAHVPAILRAQTPRGPPLQA